MSSLVNRPDNPQRRERDDLLIAVRVARPILDGSKSGLLNERGHWRRIIDHRQRRLMRWLCWIDKLDFMKRLNMGAVSLVLISPRARLIQAAKGGLQSARFGRKLRGSHAFEDQLARHEPRVTERLQISSRALVFPDDASPVAGLNDASRSKPYWSEVEIIHSTKMPLARLSVERG